METIWDYSMDAGDNLDPTIGPVLTAQRGTMFMSCPRSCRVDVREHWSSDLLRFGQCDTDAGRTYVELEQIRRWMVLHGLSLDGGVLTAELILSGRDADHAKALDIELFSAWEAATGDPDA